MKKLFIVLALSLFALNTYADVYGELSEQDYQALTATQQRDHLWTKMELNKAYAEDERPELDGPGWAGIFLNLKAFLTLGVSFDHESDLMPEGRPKVLHPLGSVAKITLRSTEDNPYDGLFQGAIGLIRLSLAGDPAQKSVGYTPGFALKLFVTGEPSKNLHVMHGLDGQGDNHNFFEHPFTNILKRPKKLALKAVGALFRLFVKHPRHLFVDHLAVFDQDGNVQGEAENVDAPYQLIFVPADWAYIDPDTELDFRDELAMLYDYLADDKVLYHIDARATKDSKEIIHIGDIVMDSPFISSRSGDKRLYFQHHRHKRQ